MSRRGGLWSANPPRRETGGRYSYKEMADKIAARAGGVDDMDFTDAEPTQSMAAGSGSRGGLDFARRASSDVEAAAFAARAGYALAPAPSPLGGGGVLRSLAGGASGAIVKALLAAGLVALVVRKLKARKGGRK